ncbi:TrmH family RNA methyltransferase [Sphingobacterium bambusae]|uniref:RNA methyltransferase n=1 Tax=Sphingobacterium bambusae TaxID=662858 RepID=A0ABW6BIV2_9SPHI|nr:RNA methyltransferase [Sphingobacterium bambusae]WPL50024.1 RNA methyltransferase [Sphingobacterium bambusae]
MLSKAQISLITSLQHKKFRKQHGLFIVEGLKSVSEFISSDYQLHSLFATAEAQAKMDNLQQNIKCITVSASELQKISLLNNPQGVVALFNLPEQHTLDWIHIRQQHSLLLDDIQDPGNLGTIIRTAEWFGIRHIICSVGTVDAYNPKVVQATMGSLSRVAITYTDLSDFISTADLPTYGALLDGNSIYETDFGEAGLIMMGNEGNGISKPLLSAIDHAVTIPRIGKAESLNVAVATTIFCSELARQRLERK